MRTKALKPPNGFQREYLHKTECATFFFKSSFSESKFLGTILAEKSSNTLNGEHLDFVFDNIP